MNWQLKYDRSRKKQCSLPKQTSEKQNPIRCQHSFRFSSMSYQNGYQLTKCTAADITKHDESRVHNMQNDEMVTISFKWITREQPCENKMCQKWHDIHTHTCAFERARIHSLYTCVCVCVWCENIVYVKQETWWQAIPCEMIINGYATTQPLTSIYTFARNICMACVWCMLLMPACECP